MAKCTAPVRGHRTASAAAECPACGGRYGYNRSYSSYGSFSSPTYVSSGRSSGGLNSSTRPSWSPTGSSVSYTTGEVKALAPVRRSVEARATLPDPRDVFLCHAWDDRRGAEVLPKTGPAEMRKIRLIRWPQALPQKRIQSVSYELVRYADESHCNPFARFQSEIWHLQLT